MHKVAAVGIQLHAYMHKVAAVGIQLHTCIRLLLMVSGMKCVLQWP